jgi:adenosine deaminase
LIRIHGSDRLPDGRSIRDLYRFEDFPGFLVCYKEVMQLIAAPDNFYELTAELLRDFKRQNVHYAEVIFTPLPHSMRGLEHAEVIAAVVAAAEESRLDGGPALRLIYDTVRQFGAGAAEETARTAVRDAEAGLPVVGFGVGGDELSTPAVELAGAFEIARDAGLKSFVHAGEWGRSDSVRAAVDILGADRIGHGVWAREDEATVRMLAERSIACDMCPTSNLLTRSVESMEAHPLQEMMNAGVPVCVGSDDPGFFGVRLEDELDLCCRTWGWGIETLEYVTLTALAHSFLDRETKQSIAEKVRNGFAQLK